MAFLTSLLNSLPGAAAQGLVWGIMAIGVYITFRVLDVADLTVDGSIATGGAVAVMLIRGGMNCWLALLCAFVSGLLAGLVTGLFHTKCGIPAILAGILTQLALYSVNLRIMSGKANQPVGVDKYDLAVSQRYVRDLSISNPLPLLLVITLSAPAGWAAHDLFFPWLRDYLPAWLPISALRPIVYLTCGIAAMAVAWLLLGVLPRRLRASCRSQLSLATCSTAVLGTMLICANQNYTILQSVAFALGSGLGYVFAVFIVREGRRRLRSKAISSIFQGLPSSMIYVGVLSLAIYALVGHTVVL